MAPRKQPTRLQAAAFNIVTKCFSNSVLYHIKHCRGEKLEAGIVTMKAEVNENIPAVLFDEFATMFLERISTTPRYKRWIKKFGTHVVDLIINDKLTKIDGFPGIDENLRDILYSNLHRFKYVTHLQIQCSATTLPAKLRECDLMHLTSFRYHHNCTDEVLSIISERCPNLTAIDVTASIAITGVGVESLKRCPRLRTVNLENCCVPTKDLIEHLLADNKIEIYEHSVYDLQNLLAFSGGVYLNLMSLYTSDIQISSAVLDVIVKNLPNLNCLFFHKNEITGDLCVLRSLTKLHSLGVVCHDGFSMAQVKHLLTEVGHRYLKFTVISHVSQLHDIVSTVYEFCKNIEFLRISVWDGHGSHQITIPSFEKLKIFSIEIFRFWTINVNLHFTRLLALEKLHLHMCSANVVSLIQDHDNFPRICKIQEPYNRKRRREVSDIIQENNLDIHYVHN